MRRAYRRAAAGLAEETDLCAFCDHGLIKRGRKVDRRGSAARPAVAPYLSTICGIRRRARRAACACPPKRGGRGWAAVWSEKLMIFPPKSAAFQAVGWEASRDQAPIGGVPAAAAAEPSRLPLSPAGAGAGPGWGCPRGRPRCTRHRGRRPWGGRPFRGTLPHHQRRQHGANRPGINAAVGVAARLAVHRADIEAGAAADAAQDVAAVPGEDLRAAVVDEDDVHLLRPVGLGRRAGPGDKLGVDGELLGRAEGARRLRRRARSRSLGTIFSIPTSAMWQRVAARQKRELPSLVTSTSRPLSATRKLAPVRPDVGLEDIFAEIGAGAAGDGLGVVVVGSQAIYSKEAAMSRRFLWMIGLTMCEG